MAVESEQAKLDKPIEKIRSAVIRFAGDSGDGSQKIGMEFTDTSAIAGNDVATLPDFPAEIRAPAGTVAGVSGYQVNFADSDIHTPGDKVDTLIVMNPAAFKANIADVEHGGIVIANETEFTKTNLRKAGYPEDYNPLEDEKYLQQFRLHLVPITRLNAETLKETGMGSKAIGQCKNMFALGLVYWLYDRSLDQTIKFNEDYFGKKKNMPQVAEANIKSLKAGYFFGETAEMFPGRYQVARASIKPGKYRKVSGNEAIALGLATASQLSGKDLVYCSYPITPASDVLHHLSAMRHFGIKTFQAEDEIAAMCAAIGVAYAGRLAATGTSGPGLALKSEALGLAIMTELPLVVVNVQRGGPSTGLPTKTEQSDLLQTMYGRNGDSPLVVIAPQSPADCFDMAIEAARIAMQHMVPVIILSDGYIANGAEPWRIPDVDSLPKIELPAPPDPESFQPYSRDEKLSRPWASPGMAGMEHRIGGIEKQHITGNVSYDDENHQFMVALRQAKVDKIADDIPALVPIGDSSGELLILGWGGTYGAIVSAVDLAREQGKSVSAAHLRYINPMPANLGKVLKQFKRVLIPELNTGQLRGIIRGKFLVDARGLNKLQGKPFLIDEIGQAIDLMLEDKFGDREFLMPHHQHISLDNQDYDFQNTPADVNEALTQEQIS